MQSNAPQRPDGSGGNGLRLGIKVAAVLCLVLVAFLAVTLKGRKPAVPIAVVNTEQPPLETVAAPEPSVPSSPPLAPRPVNAPPVADRTTTGNSQNSEPTASNLWAAAGVPAGSEKVIWRRLPTLRTGVDAVVANFERAVFYDVADRYAGELRTDFAQIARSTNDLKQLDAEFRALRDSVEVDRQDYLRHARAASEKRQNEYAAAQKRLLDLQALYLERKRKFQQDWAATKPQLQDPPGVFERKVAESDRLKQTFANDINQLETAINTVTKQVAEISQELRVHSQNLDRAFEDSARDAIGRLIGLRNRLRQQIDGVNTSINNYNSKLDRYGTPLKPVR